MKKIIISILVSLFLYSFATNTNDLPLLDSVITAISKINTLKFTILKKERVNGVYKDGETFMKIQHRPFKDYSKILSAKNKGMEVLYVTGKNGGDALINMNGFPFVNLNLDPKGTRMTENQHHVVFHSGLEYFGKILKNIRDRYKEKLIITATPNSTLKGMTGTKVEVTVPDFGYIKYTSPQDETIINLADRLYLNPRIICDKNTTHPSFTSIVKKGTSIQVPNAYCKKAIFFINKNNVPFSQHIYDEKGLFEEYIYTNLIVNPTFAADEFDEDYKDYGF